MPEPKYAKFALEYPNSFRMFIGQAPEGTIARSVADLLSAGTPCDKHHDALKALWDNTIVPFAQKASAKALRSDLAKAMCTPLTHIAPLAPAVGNGYISDDGFVFDGEETPPELSSESEAVSTDSDSDSDSEIIPPHKTRKKRKRNKRNKHKQVKKRKRNKRNKHKRVKTRKISAAELSIVRGIVGADISAEAALHIIQTLKKSI